MPSAVFLICYPWWGGFLSPVMRCSFMQINTQAEDLSEMTGSLNDWDWKKTCPAPGTCWIFPILILAAASGYLLGEQQTQTGNESHLCSSDSSLSQESQGLGNVVECLSMTMDYSEEPIGHNPLGGVKWPFYKGHLRPSENINIYITVYN